MGEDLWVSAATGLVGSALGWAGAWAQVKGGRAQAVATTDSAVVQVDAAQLQFLQSSRANACTALVAEALEFEKQLTWFNGGFGPDLSGQGDVLWMALADEYHSLPGWLHVLLPECWRIRRVGARRVSLELRQRRAVYASLVESVRILRLACAVVEMHGPDQLSDGAHKLLEGCEGSLAQLHAYIPNVPSHWARDEVAHIRQMRKHFARFASPYLGGP